MSKQEADTEQVAQLRKYKEKVYNDLSAKQVRETVAAAPKKADMQSLVARVHNNPLFKGMHRVSGG